MKANILLAQAALALAGQTFVTSQPNEHALADGLAMLPPCALSCLVSAVQHSGCLLTNQTCMCASATLKADMTACVGKSCTVKQALVTMNATAIACNEPIRDRSSRYVAVSTTFGTISGVFVVQRFIYKYWAGAPFGLDDWCTLATILVGIPDTVLNAHGIASNGIGRDIWTLTPEMITDFIHLFYLIELVYFADIALLKLALLFFYMHIFPSEGVKRVLWGTVVVVAMFGISFFIVIVFQCTPISYFWTMWDREHTGHCVNINAVGWTNAALSIALDGWMLAIPLWQIRKLQLLNWRKKIGVIFMFCMGTFITVVSILRLRSLVGLRSDSINPTWDFYEVSIWSNVEINIGIWCLCLPSARLMLGRLYSTASEWVKGTGLGATEKPVKALTRQPPRLSKELPQLPLIDSSSIIQGPFSAKPWSPVDDNKVIKRDISIV